MPELPEVETIVRGLQRAVGKKITRMEILDSRLDLSTIDIDGTHIEEISRRGKYVLFTLSSGTLSVHLRMSGRLVLTDGKEDLKHTRLILHLDDGEIRFVNPRRLGTVEFSRDGFSHHLGIELLSEAFTPARLEEIVAKSQAPIKPLLMDQRRVAGLGNIYASESLWRAGIDPRRAGNTLTSVEVRALHQGIVDVLREAIDNMGTTFSDYRTADGEKGMFQSRLAVYGKRGEKCPRCGKEIVRIKQGCETSL